MPRPLPRILDKPLPSQFLVGHLLVFPSTLAAIGMIVSLVLIAAPLQSTIPLIVVAFKYTFLNLSAGALSISEASLLHTLLVAHLNLRLDAPYHTLLSFHRISFSPFLPRNIQGDPNPGIAMEAPRGLARRPKASQWHASLGRPGMASGILRVPCKPLGMCTKALDSLEWPWEHWQGLRGHWKVLPLLVMNLRDTTLRSRGLLPDAPKPQWTTGYSEKLRVEPEPGVTVEFPE
ncbi:hypothetical protein FB451DRAFT_1466254 [Mycena latifolia]|nr:hypothetical protein FB451DRAFT_1466254 [Mycena latifolia]